MVLTCRHTPRFCGHLSSTGDLLNLRGGLRFFLTNWLIVGIQRLMVRAAAGNSPRSLRGQIRLHSLAGKVKEPINLPDLQPLSTQAISSHFSRMRADDRTCRLGPMVGNERQNAL